MIRWANIYVKSGEKWPLFVQKKIQYIYIYTYISLFGDSSKASVRVELMTKSQVFEQINQCEKKYMDVKMFEENTGTGIKKKNCGPQAVYEVLKNKCPCYHCLDALFCNKANFTSLFVSDHLRPAWEIIKQ
ncbi:hypothetical protein VP01_382g5 [Puccinia sorghi]|uniref:Uncharacterized protein n=1 Tax=Puccinia sorghi TaxID=27349 RepID=A0A0L6UT86_9BASI|nr:hypothetical protein VP01_382g5 [Puccinia sorghi]